MAQRSRRSWTGIAARQRKFPKATLVSAAVLLAIGGCSDSPTEAARQTQIVTKTITATPTDQPNLDCQTPAVTLEVTWRRDVGEGMSPTLGPKDIVPHDYAEPFSLVAAKVKITNLSPNAIHTRGVIFDAEWIDGQGTVKSTRYQYSGLVQGDTGYVPAAPRTGDRGAEQVDGGTSRELSREYRSTTPGDLRAWVRSGDSTKPWPYTWITDIDWWFTDKDVRDRCDRKLK